MLKINATLISFSESLIFHELKELFETNHRVITGHERSIVFFADSSWTTRSVGLHLLAVRQADWIICTCTHCILVVILIHILYLLGVGHTSSKYVPIFLFVVILVCVTQNLFIRQKREFSKFSNFGHFRWVC